jgi:hypothetical protein
MDTPPAHGVAPLANLLHELILMGDAVMLNVESL